MFLKPRVKRMVEYILNIPKSFFYKVRKIIIVTVSYPAHHSLIALQVLSSSSPLIKMSNNNFGNPETR